MSSHELTIYIIGGLGAVGGFLTSTMLLWLRDDIRNLATAVTSLRQEFSEVHGILKGKGIINGNS